MLQFLTRSIVLIMPISSSMIFAQGESAALGGGAGWVGTGLLGTVLAWLLGMHLPAKDKQIKEMIESRDKLALDLAKLAAESDKVKRDDFKDALKIAGDHNTGEIRHLTSAVEELRRVMQAATGGIGFESRSAAQSNILTSDRGAV